jgi:hypothetical protein
MKNEDWSSELPDAPDDVKEILTKLLRDPKETEVEEEKSKQEFVQSWISSTPEQQAEIVWDLLKIIQKIGDKTVLFV